MLQQRAFTIRGSITVQLIYCFIGLDLVALLIINIIFSCLVEPKPVKLKTVCAMMPPLTTDHKVDWGV